MRNVLSLSRPRRSPFPLPAPRVLVAAAIAFMAGPSAASAALVREPLQPLSVLTGGARPACASPVAPFEPADMLVSQSDGYQDVDATGATPDIAAEIGALRQSTLMLPSISLCSPTFGGIPGPITGTVAAGPLRARVGPGLRELGGTFLAPAPLSPGDVLSLPEVDDVAQVTLRVATSPGQPSATLALSDLAPGPSRLAISRDGRGLVATLTRADGTVSEAATPPMIVPAFAPKFSGSGRRWKVTTSTVPGSVVYAFAYARNVGTGQTFVRSTPAGTATTALTFKKAPRPRRSVSVFLATFDRASGTFATFYCRVKATAGSRPRSSVCGADSDDFYYDYSDVKASPFSTMAAGAARVLSAKKALQKVSRAFPAAPAIHRTVIRGRSASAAPAAAPLVARPIARAPRIQSVGFRGLRPLASDVNGDGNPDFWTDDIPSSQSWWPVSGGTAGYVLISSPEGLEPHRIDVAHMDDEDSVTDREISAIDDVTGDGIGELVVDLDERHGLIPGSRSWTSTTFPIRAPDPTDLGPDDYLLAPGASSAGSPYGTLDDATGDGRRELVATDDLGSWFTIASQDLRPGATSRLPSGARTVPSPTAIFRTATFDRSAPRVDPRLRTIAGQAITLRWPVVASKSAPQGTVEVSVRDARGTLVRTPTTVKTPGNALLLDYDRTSGELLLLAVAPSCLARRLADDCRETMVRVRADGSVRHSLTVDPYRSILSPAAARFIKDGPDADADVDVVTTTGNQALALIESGRTGALTERTIATAPLQNADSPYYDEVRLIPIIDGLGNRRLTAALGQPVKEGRNSIWVRSAALPTEISWK